MEPTKEQLIQLKQIELDMLRAFVNVCEQLDLRYYLLGGTLLGAVRHKGFIPWDDDIDVGMPRKDYEIFISEGQTLLPKHLFVQNLHSDPEYPMCFSKIRNSNTAFIESSVAHLNINHGVFIDIFPLDCYPEQETEQKRLRYKLKLCGTRINRIYRTNEKKSWKGKFLSAFVLLWCPSLKKAISRREKLYRQVKPSRLLVNHGGAWGAKEIVPQEWYGDGTPVIFEGLKVLAPAQYHNWLTQVYGDYMQLPPPEKRITHNAVRINFDLTGPDEIIN